MRIEAFSEGKLRDEPAANEDLLLVLPGLGHAVIDGVTDRTGHRYLGLSAGQLAARTVRDAVAAFLLDSGEAARLPARLVARVTAAIAGAYHQAGMFELARTEPSRRFGATLALAMELDTSWRLILIGDSGIRLNGAELFQTGQDLDLVTSALRQEAYRLVGAAGGDDAACERVGRACAFVGAARLTDEMQPWLDEAGLAALRRAALERCAARFPHVPPGDLELLLDGGVVDGQGHFQNNTRSPLSYAVLDGFEVPLELVQVIERPKPEVRCLELFTDGYFEPPAGIGLAAWEASFAEVERVDPAKIGSYPSVKGSSAGRYADDRSVIVLTGL